MAWRTARCLDTLLHQVDAAWPGRNKSSDGTLGDAAHQATHSEHNPDENGIVRARDITNDPAHGLVSRKLAESLAASRDPRILYVISNAQICSSKVQPWVWRTYGGPNPHREHMHISVVDNPALYDDDRPWSIDGAPAVPQQPAVPFVPLDKRTIDAITAKAAASELARYSWRDRGHAPIGYIKGMAVVYGQTLRKLAAGDSAARAMVRVVDGPGDVFDHYDLGTLGAPDIDRLRALFVVLTGLGMRESSGNYSEGRDMSASNTSADTAEAGLFQQSWNSHTTSPEIRKLFDAYQVLSDKNPEFIEIFREGVGAKNSAEFGSGDGLMFQVLAKRKPAFAVEAAAIGLRTLCSHWGPIIRVPHETEVRPEADALFREVQAIVGAPVSVPVTPPRPAPIPTPIPQPIPGETMDNNLRVALTTEIMKPLPDRRWLQLQLLDSQSTTPSTPGPIAPGPDRFPPPTVPIALPAPPAPTAPVDHASNWGAAIAATIAALGLGGAGVIGTPFGADMTVPGLISTLAPTVLAGAWPWIKQFLPVAKP